MIGGSRVWLFMLATVLLSVVCAQPAAAFCGFYVAGADSRLYANATMVVLMRDGTKTVLSIQNNYEGPPEEFALVIPVPTVLQQDQVKTLPHEVFSRVDALGAPRLVEYWELDPCRSNTGGKGGSGGGGGKSGGGGQGGTNSDVTVEASFAVGEYDILILSANNSSSLETWLTDNHYRVPEGSGDLLMPYVASGMKFFVAKVDPTRIELQAGQALLSPLRFHYDSTEFTLPIRLGLMNSREKQDLIVNIIAPDRYEVANHDNVTIPTNIRVRDEVRDDLGGFYEALFSQVVEKHEGAVVTEYAWGINSCDPCPDNVALSPSDQLTLGLDVIGSVNASDNDAGIRKPPVIANYTLTRLHYRYTRQSLGDDLVFKVAPPIQGGRGVPNRQGELSMDVAPSQFNTFQGRYAILHAWSQPFECKAPMRGYWGGPPSATGHLDVQAAANTALVGAPPKAGVLPALLAQSLTALGVTADMPLDPLKPVVGRDAGAMDAAISFDGGVTQSRTEGCECSFARPRSSGRERAPMRWLVLATITWVFASRRRTRRQRARASHLDGSTTRPMNTMVSVATSRIR